MRSPRVLIASLLFAVLGVAGLWLAHARATPAPTVHRFDAPAAYALARAQVALGPRPAGSAASHRAAAMLVGDLPNGHFEAVPGGLRNVVANNSAAAVGAVIELARALKADQRPTDRPIRFLLSDGEEAPPGFTDFVTSGLRGSRAYAAAHGSAIGDVIVLDFIGN